MQTYPSESTYMKRYIVKYLHNSKLYLVLFYSTFVLHYCKHASFESNNSFKKNVAREDYYIRKSIVRIEFSIHVCILKLVKVGKI